RPDVAALGAVEAATHAARHPAYRDHYQRTKARLGKQRGSKVARVEVARKLAEAIWHILTRSQPFAPTALARPPHTLWPLDDPRLSWASLESPIRPDPPGEEAIERCAPLLSRGRAASPGSWQRDAG